LEESYVWRARARAALGDTAGAIDDLNQALKYHKDYAPALEELAACGSDTFPPENIYNVNTPCLTLDLELVS